MRQATQDPWQVEPSYFREAFPAAEIETGDSNAVVRLQFQRETRERGARGVQLVSDLPKGFAETRDGDVHARQGVDHARLRSGELESYLGGQVRARRLRECRLAAEKLQRQVPHVVHPDADRDNRDQLGSKFQVNLFHHAARAAVRPVEPFVKEGAQEDRLLRGQPDIDSLPLRRRATVQQFKPIPTPVREPALALDSVGECLPRLGALMPGERAIAR